MVDIGPRTDSSVFVLIHEEDAPKDALTQLELGRIPVVGEYIFLPPDVCVEVIEVIHLTNQSVKKFKTAGENALKVGVNAAWIEVAPTTDYEADDLGSSIER